MATLKLKQSAVPGAIPTTTQLVLGEIAVNTFDGRLYVRGDNGTPFIEAVVSETGAQTLTNKTLTAPVINAPTGITAADISNTPAGSITATDVQAAINQLDAGKEPSLGFTPENSANKGIANGYAALDANGEVVQLPAGAAAAGAGTFLRQDGTWATPTGSGLGDMQSATYDPAGIAEQLVGLTAAQTLTNKTLTAPTINAPTGIVATDIGNTPAGSITSTNVQAAINELDASKQPTLGFTPENSAKKGAVNGYAALNASREVIQLPAGASANPTKFLRGDGVWAIPSGGGAGSPASGYWYDPSTGFRVQWGTANSNGSVTFPTAFPTSCDGVVITKNGIYSLNDYFSVSSVSRTGCTFSGYITTTIFWIAYGH